MRKKIIFLVIICLIFVSGCSSDESGKVEKKSSNDDTELKGQYRASMIVVEDEAIADNILTMINNDYSKGEKDIVDIFCDYAEKYSVDITKDSCGDLGYFNDGDLVDVVENAIKKLDTYDYTKTPVYDPGYELYYIVLRTE